MKLISQLQYILQKSNYKKITISDTRKKKKNTNKEKNC